LIASSITSSSVALSWLIPANNGGSAITSYQIYWDKNNENWQFNQICTPTFASVSGLSAGKIYRFKVKAINNVGLSNFSDLV